ncbi:MAG: SpoIIE family protein phosphatase [Clostridia bacterium]|nr:SpoIIE family protein phosphatase [Clostridia bacterium]
MEWADRHLLTEHIFIRMALSSLAAMTAGAWAIVDGGYLSYDLWGAVVSVLLSPVCAYLFYAAHDRHMRTSAFRETGILAGLAILTWSMSGWELPIVGFNLGEGLALAAAVLTGGSFGAARGGLVGLVCGIFLKPASAAAFGLAGAVTGVFSTPCSGVVFAMGQGSSRALGLVSGAVAAVILLIAGSGYEGLAGLVPEILLVTAVLLPFYSYDKCRLPAHWCGVIPDTGRSERTAVAEMVLAGREKKLSALGNGIRSLGEMLGGVSEKLARPGPREMRDLAEGCFDTYCERCAQKIRCREKDFAQWQRMLGGMGTALAEDGGVCGADVPAELAGRCAVMGRVLDEINASAARRIGERRSGDRLRVAAEDYTQMGRLLSESAKLEEEEGAPDPELTARLERILSCHDFAAGSVAVYGSRHKRIFVHDIDLSGTRMGGEEITALFGSVVGMPLSPPEFSLNGSVLSMELHTRESCRCEWGKSARSAASLAHPVENPEESVETGAFSTGSDTDRAARAPSGDTVCAFSGDGRQYMLLSDGMGTGRMAALTSGMAAVFLERMLTAGAGLETALKMLNNVIRAGCEECAATVDLCEIDLVTLEARFVKSGAAPSFVIRDGSLFRLQSKTVPIGILRALDAEMIRFTVQPGDVIVMLSDGIARSFEECPWLLDLLSTDNDIQGGDVTRAAEKIVAQAAERGARDDITAGVMRILA